MDKKSDAKTLLSRANDALLLCEKQYTAKAFGFLTPTDAAIIKREFASRSFDGDIKCSFFGGYQDAERCLFLAYPSYGEDTVYEEFITLLEIKGRDINLLSHRDFLGSILGLGIKREKVGDILCLEDRCLVFVSSDIADYIISNLDKVSRCGVKVCAIDINEAKIPEKKFEEIRTTVASLRLDAVVAAALKTSRTVAAEVISEKRVSVNWQETENVAFKVSPGDVFSVRGKGRFKLTEEINETRKGRLGICIQKAL